MSCCNLPLGARWPVVILVLVMNALGASSSAVSGRPTPPTGVPVWAVLLSHVPGQTVYMRADQPLVLAWRLDLDAVQAVAQWSGIEDGVRAGDLVFGLVVDGELVTSQGLPATGSTDQLTFQLHVGSACNAGRCQVESVRLSLQLAMSGPGGPIGQMTDQMELIIRDEHERRSCSILVLVLSARENFASRQRIRLSWERHGSSPRVYFLVGDAFCELPPSVRKPWTCEAEDWYDPGCSTQHEHDMVQSEVQACLEREAAENGDLVFLPVKDYYRNLPRKLKEA